jgi:hypothetical protein
MTYLSKFDIQFEVLRGKKNSMADLISRIAERSTYQHDLPYLEESDELDDSMLGAIQLRRGKVLLESRGDATDQKEVESSIWSCTYGYASCWSYAISTCGSYASSLSYTISACYGFASIWVTVVALATFPRGSFPELRALMTGDISNVAIPLPSKDYRE